MKRLISTILLAIGANPLPACAEAPRKQAEPIESVPRQAGKVFEAQLAKTCEIAFHLNPFYLHGNFSDDGKLDTALLVKNKSSGKYGIAMFLSGHKR